MIGRVACSQRWFISMANSWPVPSAMIVGNHGLTLPSVYEDEVLPRVLGLGAEAEILSPESARQKVAAVLQALMVKYQTAFHARFPDAAASPAAPRDLECGD